MPEPQTTHRSGSADEAEAAVEAGEAAVGLARPEGVRRVALVITATSEQTARRHEAVLAWRGEVSVVPNGVPSRPPRPELREQLRGELGIGPDEFVFLSVGNVRPEEGFEDLLAAARADAPWPSTASTAWRNATSTSTTAPPDPAVRDACVRARFAVLARAI